MTARRTIEEEELQELRKRLEEEVRRSLGPILALAGIDPGASGEQVEAGSVAAATGAPAPSEPSEASEVPAAAAAPSGGGGGERSKPARGAGQRGQPRGHSALLELLRRIRSSSGVAPPPVPLQRQHSGGGAAETVEAEAPPVPESRVPGAARAGRGERPAAVAGARARTPRVEAPREIAPREMEEAPREQQPGPGQLNPYQDYPPHSAGQLQAPQAPPPSLGVQGAQSPASSPAPAAAPAQRPAGQQASPQAAQAPASASPAPQAPIAAAGAGGQGGASGGAGSAGQQAGAPAGQPSGGGAGGGGEAPGPTPGEEQEPASGAQGAEETEEQLVGLERFIPQLRQARQRQQQWQPRLPRSRGRGGELHRRQREAAAAATGSRQLQEPTEEDMIVGSNAGLLARLGLLKFELPTATLISIKSPGAIKTIESLPLTPGEEKQLLDIVKRVYKSVKGRTPKRIAYQTILEMLTKPEYTKLLSPQERRLLEVAARLLHAKYLLETARVQVYSMVEPPTFFKSLYLDQHITLDFNAAKKIVNDMNNMIQRILSNPDVVYAYARKTAISMNKLDEFNRNPEPFIDYARKYLDNLKNIRGAWLLPAYFPVPIAIRILEAAQAAARAAVEQLKAEIEKLEEEKKAKSKMERKKKELEKWLTLSKKIEAAIKKLKKMLQQEQRAEQESRVPA